MILRKTNHIYIYIYIYILGLWGLCRHPNYAGNLSQITLITLVHVSTHDHVSKPSIDPTLITLIDSYPSLTLWCTYNPNNPNNLNGP